MNTISDAHDFSKKILDGLVDDLRSDIERLTSDRETALRNLRYIQQVANSRILDTGAKATEGAALLEIEDRAQAVIATIER